MSTTTPDGRDGSGGGPRDARLVALGRVVERSGQRIDNVETLLRQLAADVAMLARSQASTGGGGRPATPAGGDDPGNPGDPGNGGGGPAVVRSWLLAPDQVDPEQAAAGLVDLVEWLDRVFLRYHGATLSSCWLWHPDVVEELWWLRCAHAEAYDPEAGSWVRAGDWHDRQRPGVVKRINTIVGACELSLHVPDQLHAHPPRLAPLGGQAHVVAAAWADPAASGGRGGPAPSAEQLAEADACQQEQFRRRR